MSPLQFLSSPIYSYESLRMMRGNDEMVRNANIPFNTFTLQSEVLWHPWKIILRWRWRVLNFNTAWSLPSYLARYLYIKHSVLTYQHGVVVASTDWVVLWDRSHIPVLFPEDHATPINRLLNLDSGAWSTKENLLSVVDVLSDDILRNGVWGSRHTISLPSISCK